VRAEVAVAFRAVSPSTHEQIARSLEAMLMRARALSSPTIIVVHPDQEPRTALERDLARLGKPAHGASTILEAIWHLEDHVVHYEAAIIAADLDANLRAEILCHLEERHPEVRRVLLFGSHVESLDHASSRRVHVVLRTPWRLKGLARAVV
jgi:ActR/RegA family two-component response regulator